MKEESLLLLSDLQKLINQVVLIDYTIIILGGVNMLKIRLQGTKNDIRWFVRLLQRDKRFDVNNVSTFSIMLE